MAPFYSATHLRLWLRVLAGPALLLSEKVATASKPKKLDVGNEVEPNKSASNQRYGPILCMPRKALSVTVCHFNKLGGA